MGAVIEGPCCAGETDPQKTNLVSRNPKDEYEVKCEKLCKKMQGKIKTKGEVEHDRDEQNTWQYMSQIADVCRDSVDEFLEKLVNATNKLDTDDTKNDDIPPPQIIKASVKDESEAKQEVESLYNGNWHRVIDCCRASIIYDNYKQLYYILLILAKYNQNCCGFEILRIGSNSTQTEAGYGDNQLEIIINMRPVQTKGGKGKKRKIDLKKECTSNQLEILKDLQMDMDLEDPDEPEPEFLNLPAHVITVNLNKRE